MKKKSYIIITLFLVNVVFSCISLLSIDANLVYADKEARKDTAIWWGCAAIELNISGNNILIDPYFPFRPKAELILITHVHYDHCHVPTIKNLIQANQDNLDMIVGSLQCEEKFQEFDIKKEHLVERWEKIEFKGLNIETVPSFEGKTDVGYIIRDPQTDLSILHMGDNTKYDEVFTKIKDIDYLFFSIGKMSYQDTISFLKLIKTKYLIPMHYKPKEGALYDYKHPSPKNPEEYIAKLENQIKEDKLTTKVLIFKPGESNIIDPIE